MKSCDNVCARTLRGGTADSGSAPLYRSAIHTHARLLPRRQLRDGTSAATAAPASKPATEPEPGSPPPPPVQHMPQPPQQPAPHREEPQEHASTVATRRVSWPTAR